MRAGERPLRHHLIGRGDDAIDRDGERTDVATKTDDMRSQALDAAPTAECECRFVDHIAVEKVLDEVQATVRHDLDQVDFHQPFGLVIHRINPPA